ncbi:MAG: hypothetical protein MRK02_02145 [Candidatus Scalindua sp.]|nr:hypothetical protein [Candidatus Scalindua sp.]
MVPDVFSNAFTHDNIHRLARVMLFVFLVTFALTRITVFMIMARWIPDFYLHLGGTHVHHLNYGIFLLSGIGAYLLFLRSIGGALLAAAIVYGVGLALTFDEFGMWLHLGGSYWQRASFDCVSIVAALLGLVAFAPPIQRIRSADWRAVAVAAVDLKQSMSLNTQILVWIIHGVFDLVAPYYATVITVNQMVLDPAIRKNIQLKVYHGGHMPYLHQRSLDTMFEDADKFYNSIPGVKQENINVKLKNKVPEADWHTGFSPYNKLNPVY